MDLVSQLKTDYPDLNFVAKMEVDENKFLNVLYVNGKKLDSWNVEVLLNDLISKRITAQQAIYEYIKKDINNLMLTF